MLYPPKHTHIRIAQEELACPTAYLDRAGDDTQLLVHVEPTCHAALGPWCHRVDHYHLHILLSGVHKCQELPHKQFPASQELQSPAVVVPGVADPCLVKEWRLAAGAERPGLEATALLDVAQQIPGQHTSNTARVAAE